MTPIELSGDNEFGKVTNFQGSFTFEAWVLNDGSQTWATYKSDSNDPIGIIKNYGKPRQ